MACGCGGSKQVNLPAIQHTVQRAVPRAMPQMRVQPVPIPIVRGLKVCKCGYPMSLIRRYVPTLKKEIVVYMCTNNRCMAREEIK